MTDKKILIICGATASGKSARAIEVAQAQNGVIINCDSMQVYRELEIITARPSKQDYAQAEHRLYGFMPANQACSAAKWLKYATQEIDAAFARGKLPIITGGTGLYIKALTDGLSPIPEIPEEYRIKATALWQDLAGEALQAIDPT
ncbi:MAG: isopentenyl transferase family protein, partial [Pseudomonadota bacterium]